MTPAESRHIQETKLFIGCLPCLLRGYVNSHADYHHVAEGRKRVGHLVGFGMCLWHHRGHKLRAQDSLAAHKAMIGPSFALDKAEFVDEFGSERMLVEVNNFALQLWKMYGWLEHDLPIQAAVDIKKQHAKYMAVD